MKSVRLRKASKYCKDHLYVESKEKEVKLKLKKKVREWKVVYQTLEGWGELGKVAKRVKTFSYWRSQV